MAACPLTRISRPSPPVPRTERILVTFWSTAFSSPSTGTDTTATLPLVERTGALTVPMAPGRRCTKACPALRTRAMSADVNPEGR